MNTVSFWGAAGQIEQIPKSIEDYLTMGLFTSVWDGLRKCRGGGETRLASGEAWKSNGRALLEPDRNPSPDRGTGW